MLWASRPLDTPVEEFLAALESSMPVSLIATRRADLKCSSQEGMTSLPDGHELKGFDQVPLLDAGEEIEAVFLKGRGMVQLHEGMFMASDAPLLAFVETADVQRFRFLVDGGKVYGLVTISDLQRLPVYSVLFGLVVAVEMLLMDWIRKKCLAEPKQWMGHLHKKQRNRIEHRWDKAKQKDLELDRLSCATFTDELCAAVGLGLLSKDDDQHQHFEQVIALRNQICHSQEIAGSLTQADQLPRLARNARDLIQWLSGQVKAIAP